MTQAAAGPDPPTALRLSPLATPPPPPPPPDNPTAAAPLPALISLHNVTLLLPDLDYLTLATLATDRPSSSAAATTLPAALPLTPLPRVRPCLNGTTLQRVDAAAAAAAAVYSGWRVGATQLLVRPASGGVIAELLAACLAAQQLPAGGGMAGAEGGGGGDSGGAALSPGAQAAVIAACCVSGAALLAAAAWAVVVRRRLRCDWAAGVGRGGPSASA